MLALLLVVLMIVRFTYLRVPGTDLGAALLATAAQVADALIGAVLAALGVAVLLLYVFPPPEGTYRVLAPGEIAGFLRAEATNTHEWSIRARTAVYFRARTLRWLAESATARTISIRLVLMDPRDEALARRYLMSSSQGGDQWDPRRVSLEICASILTCVQQMAQHPRLRIMVSISPASWVISLDISTRQAIVCGQGANQPAHAYGVGSSYYDTYRSEFEGTFEGGQELDLRAVSATTFDGADKVRTALRELGLDDVVRRPDDFDLIVRMITHPHDSNRYG